MLKERSIVVRILSISEVEASVLKKKPITKKIIKN